MILISRNNESGFSLIEVVVGLVVFAVLASMFVSYLGSPLLKSVIPVVRLQDTFTLQQAMENIRADFDTNEWTIAELKTAMDAEDAKTATNKEYGPYIVGYNEYVKFSANDDILDTSGDNDYLKITITTTDGDFSLSRLFSD